MDALKPVLNGVSILGLLFTLIVMFALKGDLILERPAIVLEMAIPMALFFAFMFFLALLIGSRLRFPYGDGGRGRLQLHRAATSRSPSPSPSPRSRPRSRWRRSSGRSSRCR